MKNNSIFVGFFLVMMLCLMPVTVTKAATIIEPSGDKTGVLDYRHIAAGLREDGDIILKDGETYYLRGILYVRSNQSITATGAEIISRSGAFRNKPTKTNYNSISNFTVDGGTWKNVKKDGFKNTMIQFSHGKNITIKNATVYCNNQGHSIELIACKNVNIDNCVLKGLGKCPTNSVEEQLQIDLATPVTAPTLKEYGKKFLNGQICQNITVKNCTISGARGVCANYASKEKKYQSKFHKNIVLKNNKITGNSAEAVALFNVMGATVENNTIVTKSKRTNTAYSVGLHIAMFGKAPSGMNKAVYKVNNNTIKGGRQGFYVYSHSGSQFGSVTGKSNKCYAKAGKGKAILVDKKSVKKTSLKKNKLYNWK